MTFYQDCSNHLNSSKNMAARGRGLFSLYIYIVKLKNLLVRNHWTDSHIILQKCSFDNPLQRLFKPFGFVKKHGRQGAGLIFPIYLYRKLKKNLLVRNHWINCYIILQKCSFGDSAQRLFKPLGFAKKHGRQGAGLIFPIYLYSKLKNLYSLNLKNLLVRNHWTDFIITWQKCYMVTLYQDCLSNRDSSKTWPLGGGAHFPFISI